MEEMCLDRPITFGMPISREHVSDRRGRREPTSSRRSTMGSAPATGPEPTMQVQIETTLALVRHQLCGSGSVVPRRSTSPIETAVREFVAQEFMPLNAHDPLDWLFGDAFAKRLVSCLS